MPGLAPGIRVLKALPRNDVGGQAQAREVPSHRTLIRIPFSPAPAIANVIAEPGVAD
jgi:hypothetical protein